MNRARHSARPLIKTESVKDIHVKFLWNFGESVGRPRDVSALSPSPLISLLLPIGFPTRPFFSDPGGISSLAAKKSCRPEKGLMADPPEGSLGRVKGDYAHLSQKIFAHRAQNISSLSSPAAALWNPYPAFSHQNLPGILSWGPGKRGPHT